MKLHAFLASVVAGLLLVSAAHAQWFTESFDSYFSGTCDVASPCDCTPDPVAFDNAGWDAAPGSAIGAIDHYSSGTCPSGNIWWNPPFAWRMNKIDPYQAVRSLIPSIQSAGGAGVNAVNGTAANPLVVTYRMWLNTAGKEDFTSMWLELFAGPAPYMNAPIRAPGVSTCTNNVCVGGPMDGQACTTDTTCTAMKLERTGAAMTCVIQNKTPSVPRPSIAYGAYGGGNGLIPKPPCIALINNALERPVLFDGDAWWQMKPGAVPEGSDGTGLYNNMRDAYVVLTIYDTTVDITVTGRPNADATCVAGVCRSDSVVAGQSCTSNSQCRPYVTGTKTGVPRRYLGPFQNIAMGAGPTNDTLAAENGVFYRGSQYAGFIDDIAITGGEFVTVPTGSCCLPSESVCLENVIQVACDRIGGEYGGDGSTCATSTCFNGACCAPDGTCSEIEPAACTAVGGTFHGANSLCSDANILCCPNPWPDKDADGDVDMDDFGAFQACLTGSPVPSLSKTCQCFDRDNNESVDEVDFGAFSNCVTGPSIPYQLQNLPAGCQ